MMIRTGSNIVISRQYAHAHSAPDTAAQPSSTASEALVSVIITSHVNNIISCDHILFHYRDGSKLCSNPLPVSDYLEGNSSW